MPFNPQHHTSPKRVTQRDIALATGLGRATISYALGNNPKIPGATRKLVQDTARRIGYTPDPMLSSLAFYRSQQRPVSYHGTLAWLVYADNEIGNPWRQSPHYLGYYEGAMKRSLEHGYTLEEISFNVRTMSLRRINAILKARNISGIFLCPLPAPDMAINFPWDDFSFITLGYTLQHPRSHAVCAAHYQNVSLALRMIRSRGYRRIGLIIDRAIDLRCRSSISTAYLTDQHQCDIPFARFIPPHYDYNFLDAASQHNITSLLRYVKTHRLDAVLTGDYKMLAILRDFGISIPDDLGVACLNLLTDSTDFSGIVEDLKCIGSVAIDQLVAMIQRGERGVPENPIRSHVEGKWHEGSSLRAAVTTDRGLANLPSSRLIID